jgi:tetratricopeptide (TPR) repeat protein
MDNQCDFCISYIGNAKLNMGDYPGTIRAYTILIDKDSYKLNDALFKRSFCKLKINDYRGVILDCNRLIELNPKDKNAYSYRASAFYHLHKLNDACLDWSKAGELGDDDAYKNIKNICN